MDTLHEVGDWGKVAQIAASIRAEGWLEDTFLILDGEQLLTGTHRYAAAREAGLSEAEIPTVQLAEVLSEYGLDLNECLAEVEAERPGTPRLVAVAIVVNDYLTEQERQPWGLDLDTLALIEAH